MQYSPKLKKAMEEIKDILKKNDIAGFVVLHTPGFSEYLNHVIPSYSCAKFENGELRFRLKTAEVGKDKAREIANGTMDMITAFVTQIGKHAIGYIDAEKMLKERWKPEYLPGDESSHEQQNN